MRPAAFAAALLTACAAPAVPLTAPTLTLIRPDARHVVVTLIPPPASAQWILQASQECGAAAGPLRSGEWPGGAAVLALKGARGDLLTIWADGVRLADCVPPLGWNTAQGFPNL